MNNIVINGNLTKEIKIIPTKNGKKMVALDIAHNSFKTKDPMYLHVTSTDEKAVAFAEKWLKKGSSIVVTGELSILEREVDGKKYVNKDIFATSISFYGNSRKKEDEETA